ncbi:MAG: response regulator [Deltaproteobacteria bacterium]|nr:response regulator [Deltaproteobacteria bacterium]
MIQDKCRWFVDIEKAAYQFYAAAAEMFSVDKELHELLLNLEADERKQYAVIKAIQILAEGMPALELSFFVDEPSMSETLAKLQSCMERVTDGSLTKTELMHAIAEIEFAEHNDFYLYTVNSIKDALPGLITTAIDFNEHRGRIERFIEYRPEFSDVIEKIRLLPIEGTNRLLVVDDEETLVEAFNKLLAEHGVVDGAANGQEALAKIAVNEYAAIITDVMMPVMDGLEFYKKAIEKYPHLKDRFIFLTNFGDKYYNFFEQNSVRYLEKPASIKDIKKALAEVLQH